eukprot:m.137600 g.137600  ORF g.137600 m.137600 type:complete len:682 (-) comp14755_c0_seq3:95-2140(-)
MEVHFKVSYLGAVPVEADKKHDIQPAIRLLLIKLHKMQMRMLDHVVSQKYGDKASPEQVDKAKQALKREGKDCTEGEAIDFVINDMAVEIRDPASTEVTQMPLEDLEGYVIKTNMPGSKKIASLYALTEDTGQGIECHVLKCGNKDVDMLHTVLKKALTAWKAPGAPKEKKESSFKSTPMPQHNGGEDFDSFTFNIGLRKQSSLKVSKKKKNKKPDDLTGRSTDRRVRPSGDFGASFDSFLAKNSLDVDARSGRDTPPMSQENLLEIIDEKLFAQEDVVDDEEVESFGFPDEEIENKPNPISRNPAERPAYSIATARETLEEKRARSQRDQRYMNMQNGDPNLDYANAEAINRPTPQRHSYVNLPDSLNTKIDMSQARNPLPPRPAGETNQFNVGEIPQRHVYAEPMDSVAQSDIGYAKPVAKQDEVEYAEPVEAPKRPASYVAPSNHRTYAAPIYDEALDRPVYLEPGVGMGVGIASPAMSPMPSDDEEFEGFSGMPPAVPPRSRPNSAQAGYIHNLGRGMAEVLLLAQVTADGPPGIGTFLVRQSTEKANKYVLCVVTPKGQVMNMRLQTNESNQIAIPLAAKRGGPFFQRVEGLVQHYYKNRIPGLRDENGKDFFLKKPVLRTKEVSILETLLQEDEIKKYSENNSNKYMMERACTKGVSILGIKDRSGLIAKFNSLK